MWNDVNVKSIKFECPFVMYNVYALIFSIIYHTFNLLSVTTINLKCQIHVIRLSVCICTDLSISYHTFNLLNVPTIK